VALDPWIEGYDVAAHVFIPSGQPGSGYTHVTVAFYSDTDCSAYLTAASSGNFSGLDNWELIDFTGWTPDGAASARIAVANQKTASGDFQTYADALHFARNPEMIFADGFESGGLTAWSVVR